MEYKYPIVVDKDGYAKEFVRVVEIDGIEKLLGWTLSDGERLVYEDIATANQMVKPRWTENGWIETATLEEIEASHPKPEPPEPDARDLLAAEMLETMINMQQQNDLALASVIEMIMEG